MTLPPALILLTHGNLRSKYVLLGKVGCIWILWVSSYACIMWKHNACPCWMLYTTHMYSMSDPVTSTVVPVLYQFKKQNCIINNMKVDNAGQLKSYTYINQIGLCVKDIHAHLTSFDHELVWNFLTYFCPISTFLWVNLIYRCGPRFRVMNFGGIWFLLYSIALINMKMHTWDPSHNLSLKKCPSYFSILTNYLIAGDISRGTLRYIYKMLDRG